MFDAGAVILLYHWRPSAAFATRLSQAPWIHLLVALAALAGAGAMAGVGAFSGDNASQVIDLGNRSAGGHAEQDVYLENPMDAPVEVASVRTSCPCLTLQLERSVLAPREKVRARLALDLRTEPDFAGELFLQAKGLTRDGNVVFIARARAAVGGRE